MRDEPSRRRIEVGRSCSRVGDDRRQARGEFLAQFDAPLVERVDVPDRAFGEHFVFVEGDEPAEHARIETLVEERARRAAAGEALVRRQSFCVGLARALLAGQRLGLFGRTAVHQGLSLREGIGDQEIVMMRVGLRRRRRDEQVQGNDLRSLMDELEEGVLAIGAGFAPYDRAGRRIGGEPSSWTCLPLLSICNCWR